MNFAEESAIPGAADPLLKKALNIGLFTPGKPTRAELRAALGLEMVDEPVPEGVYLVHSEAALGGIYVQGDMDEIILAIEAGFQVISFRRGIDTWLLKFSPAQSQTFFVSPLESLTFNRVPLGIIMVNGRIHSLGGGIINAAGEAELKLDEAIPCILRGVSLTIVSSDEVKLSSHLIHECVKWLDGIPYLKDSTSQLMIYANGRDFMDETEKAGKILINPNAPAELKLQATLTAKNSIEIGGTQKTIALAGGLQAGNVSINGNTFMILPDERMLSTDIIPVNSPSTTSPLLVILSFRPLQWNELP